MEECYYDGSMLLYVFCVARVFRISTLSVLSGLRVSRTATTSNPARGHRILHESSQVYLSKVH